MEIPETQTTRVNSLKATLFFSLLLLFFMQTLTVWLESIYRISLTKLAPGSEMSGLLFVCAPVCVLLCPESAQRKLLGISLMVFLSSRALLPFVGSVNGVLIGGVGVGVFLILLSLLLSRPFKFMQADAGIALGLALMMSISLRAWGGSFDVSLGRSGAILGWIMAALALGLYWNLSVTAKAGLSSEPPAVSGSWWPALGLFASLTLGYLVLSSPDVVEAWLGFDNTPGPVICAVALGGAVILLGRGWPLSRYTLVLWNLLLAATLVGGILALRIAFPETPASPAVIVRPENPTARWLLNLMLLFSPVVLLNARAMCQSLGNARGARQLAVPLFLGMTLLVLLTLLSIFTNVWGYVGSLSAPFRNQFHIPFLLASLFMIGALFRSGSRQGSMRLEPLASSKGLTGAVLVLVLCALAGTWHHRPVTASTAPLKSKPMTILTYNLQQGADLNGNRNWENQLSLLKKINADLIGLQESDTPRPSNGNVSAAKYFGAKLGYHIYYGPNTVSGTYGTAILSRYPLKNPRTFFTFSDQDEVGTAVAEFELDGKKFAFFNSHPSGRIPRKCHAEELVRQAAPYAYVIAVGDYNTRPAEEVYRMITMHWKDSWLERYPDGAGRLHPELRPYGAARAHGSSGQISSSGDTITLPDRIDHIFVSPPLKVVESFYLPAPDSQTDHPAHWATVTWD